MGIPVLIEGESGSGKSRSLKNFKPGEISVFNVAGKPLPFRTAIATVSVNKLAEKNNVTRYVAIKTAMKKSKAKAFAIDDSQSLMAFDSFDKANEKGYEKFTNMAVNFEKLIEFIINDLADDVIVYFLHHVELADNGKYKAKTIGKMLDNQLTLEGLFSIVLFCTADENHHCFITQSKGISTAKSPEEMFPEEIENDLKAVDTAIREYWGLAPNELEPNDTESEENK